MLLSKGAENIFQGEYQLLTIARTIAFVPKIIFFDEAISKVYCGRSSLWKNYIRLNGFSLRHCLGEIP